MSGFKKCIINGVKEGLISESQAHKLRDNLEELQSYYQINRSRYTKCLQIFNGTR